MADTKHPAEVLAAELRPTIPCDVLKLWADDAAAELRRLAESEAKLLGALERLCGGSNSRFSGGRWDECRALIATTKEARNG